MLLGEAMRLIWGDALLDSEGMRNTPDRVIKHWLAATEGLGEEAAEHLGKTFECPYDEMVLIKNIPFTSLCEHHLLTFYGVAHVGYIPQGRVVGLSKVPRCLDTLAARPQMQERLTYEMAQVIQSVLQPLGTIVVIEAQHSCMSCRGVKKEGSKTLTSLVLGLFKENAASRAEAFSLIAM